MKHLFKAGALPAAAALLGSCLLSACDERRVEWTATPTSNLDALHDVSVSGSGLLATDSRFVGVYQCLASAVDLNGCTWLDALTADSSGVFSGVVQVRQTAPTACDAPGKCTLAIEVGGALMPQTIPLSFKPVGPSVVGTLRVASAPVAGEPTQLAGSGWASGTAIYLGLCLNISPCNWDLTLADASGNFAGTITPTAYLTSGIALTTWGATMLNLVDCTTPGNCSFGARDFRQTTTTLVPALVRPAARAVGTARTQSPVPFRDNVTPAPITLDGSGWVANERLIAYQCPASRRDCVTIAEFTTDAAGAFSASTQVYPSVTSARLPRPTHDYSFTCYLRANDCEILVTNGLTGLALSPRIPLEFVQQP